MNPIKILFLGDVVGQSGFRALFSGLGALMREEKPHLVALNGENLADGAGLTPDHVEKIRTLGVTVITTGNHVWRRSEIISSLDSDPRLLRPLNYPPGTPGHGTVVVDAAGVRVGFINIQGLHRMDSALDCPFRTAKKAVEMMRKETKLIVVDFHAEDVREKEALAHYLDGRVSAVLGTHTHVATTDERILPGGTAAVTDVGMCGPEGSVIGATPDLSMRRALTQLSLKTEILDGPGGLSGAVITVDTPSGRAQSIRRIRFVPELG